MKNFKSYVVRSHTFSSDHHTHYCHHNSPLVTLVHYCNIHATFTSAEVTRPARILSSSSTTISSSKWHGDFFKIIFVVSSHTIRRPQYPLLPPQFPSRHTSTLLSHPRYFYVLRGHQSTANIKQQHITFNFVLQIFCKLD